MGKKFYRTNQFIRAPQLRVIGEDGKQIGVLPLNEALEKARELDLDLVEVAPQAQPPVAKIINFKKFIYQEEKREREAKKKIKGGETKEIRVAPFTAEADLKVRIRKAEEFLKEGNKVKVAVRFLGRQLGKREFGYGILKKITEALKESAQAEGEPKWQGRSLILTLAPIKEGKKDAQETQNQKINQPEI